MLWLVLLWIVVLVVWLLVWTTLRHPFQRTPLPADPTRPPSPGPPSAGPPKISRFFFPSPTTIFFLSSLSYKSSRGILVVFLKAGTLTCATFGHSGCHVRLLGPPGLPSHHTQPENSKREHLTARRFQTPPKFHEKTPRESQKE